MDSRELSEWLAYDRIEPLPDSYWQAGMLASVMANLWGGGKRRFAPEDFMPAQSKPHRTPAEGRALLEMMAARQAHLARHSGDTRNGQHIRT